ncbi:MAG TPA: TIR domain-containing protein [Bryobacteraceae bacterium]|nr:TIR domain-containing protein [Bryobacteraceae bacterium]
MHTPLLVHLLFHPTSAAARSLAAQLNRALNDDPAVPGLRVPTVFAAEDGSCLPPVLHDIEEAERSVVVVLADDYMAVEPEIPPGRKTWASFIGDIWEGLQGSPHRFIPIQLSEHAWPLDSRLRETSFLRALQQTDESRTAWTARALIVELCRYLAGEQRGERLPLRLFLSHAKQDVSAPPQVFTAIVEHLQATQPVKAWIDSADIEGGSRFSQEIEKGVFDSALLVLATRNYGTRPWCRKEVLLAKRHQRPFVVIEALEGLDPRSFPYAGNVPRLRWSDGCAERAVDLVLKESLRHLHVRLLLNRQKREGDTILTAPPELATVTRLPRNSAVLYPDPPLGDEEIDELVPLGLLLETPLQRAADGRPLRKVPIAISISESGDSERYGVTSAHLEAALYEISRQLLVRGACLEYGGHLGAEGYTTALFDMANEYSAASGLPPAERIVNDVGWPLPLLTLPVATRARYQHVAKFRRIARPEGVASLEPETFVEEPTFFPPDSPVRRYAWARGMTAMREAQAKTARARVLLGGKVGPTLTMTTDGRRETRWYSGRIPGVVEEALVSLKAGQALYLMGAFGGAARLVIDLLEGRRRDEFTWEFQKAAPHAAEMRRLYDQHGPQWESYEEMTSRFSSAGVSELARQNGLSVDQNRELFHCRDVVRLVELLLEGLSKLGARSG